MARQKGIINLRGKSNNEVHTIGKNGNFTRGLPTNTEKQKKAKRDLPQNKRTALLNALSSAVRSAAVCYAGALARGSFYQSLNEAFRSEPADDRILLLQKIMHKEINMDYQFIQSLKIPEATIAVKKTFYNLEIEISSPPFNVNHNTAYYLQFVLLVWNGENDLCRHTEESTAWIPIRDQTAKYVTVKFKRTAADSEYLLACRCVMSADENEPFSFTSTAMRFLTAGAVSAEAIGILAKRNAELIAARDAPPVKAPVKQKKRVAVRDKK